MPTLEISEETLEKIKEQLQGDDTPAEIANHPAELIGNKYLFRTVTYHIVGRVEGFLGNSNTVRLSNASWVADSGRFSDAIKKGSLIEVEPVGTAYLNLDTVTDFFPWNHKLPTKQS